MKPEAKGVRIRKLTVMANFQDKKEAKSFKLCFFDLVAAGGYAPNPNACRKWST